MKRVVAAPKDRITTTLAVGALVGGAERRAAVSKRTVDCAEAPEAAVDSNRGRTGTPPTTQAAGLALAVHKGMKFRQPPPGLLPGLRPIKSPATSPPSRRGVMPSRRRWRRVGDQRGGRWKVSGSIPRVTAATWGLGGFAWWGLWEEVERLPSAPRGDHYLGLEVQFHVGVAS